MRSVDKTFARGAAKFAAPRAKCLYVTFFDNTIIIKFIIQINIFKLKINIDTLVLRWYNLVDKSIRRMEMKKAVVIIFLIINFCLMPACSCNVQGDTGISRLYFAEDFKTEYTIEEHEEKIRKVFGYPVDKTCEDVKILYSLQEEPRFYIVHYKQYEILTKINPETHMSYDERGECTELYGLGFIHNDKYYLHTPRPEEQAVDMKKVFEEYRDKKVYHMYHNEYAYENEEGKKMYIGDDEWFIKNKLGGQIEVKEKYYDKVRSYMVDHGLMKTWDNWKDVDRKECGLISESELKSAGCAG